MDGQQPFLSKFIRQNLLFVGLFSASLVLIAIGLFQYVSPTDKEIQFVPAEAAEEAAVKMFIDVAGAVEKPGVYELEGNARIQDALTAAGGLSAEADRELIARSVNLAQPATDGMKIYVPFVGEEVEGFVPGESEASAGTLGTNSSGLININSASQSELESLPKIGEVTAQKIIDNRPYTKVEELLEKKVVGQKTYEEVKDLVSIF